MIVIGPKCKEDFSTTATLSAILHFSKTVPSKSCHSHQKHPDRLYGAINVISYGYRKPFPWGWCGRSVTVITHLHLVPKLSVTGAITPILHASSQRIWDQICF